MGLVRRKCLSILVFIVFPLCLFGCTFSEKEETPNIAAEEIKLNSGAMLKSEEGNYKLYNYENGKYSVLRTEDIVLAYDKNSSNYICLEDAKPYVVHNGKRDEVKDKEYIQIKLSRNGNYLSYFIQNDGLKLKIFDINSNEEIKMKSNVAISGTLYDWYDENTLVYYGVRDDGTNGLFIYDIKEKKEDLLYKINEGYLAYLKGTEDNVLFLQITLDNERELLSIDKKTKNVEILSHEIEEIEDVVCKNDKFYFLGRQKNNVNSLYEINKNNTKRLVFDFPNIVETEKKLAIDENGNILFIGLNTQDSHEEQIFKYSMDGTISSVLNSGSDYIFLEYRN